MFTASNRFDAQVYKIDAAVPKKALEARLRTIDRRVAEIDAVLAAKSDDYAGQELQHEKSTLLALRRQAEVMLHPAPKPALDEARAKAQAEQRQRDVHFLKAAIRERLENLAWNAERAAAAGNHRQARLLREQMPVVPEQVCAEYGKDVALLAEIEIDNDPKEKRK